jgi:hypothetical protein
MKWKTTTVLVLLAVVVLMPAGVLADKPIKTDSQDMGTASTTSGSAGNGCTRIQDGTLHASDGSLITTGYDQWGYNYQAHMFNGLYCNYDRNPADCGDDLDELMMKWNDAWLSNSDCDGDGLLDHHYGYPTYIGSGAWLTNHEKGSYAGDDGRTCKYEYFVKIVAAPADATPSGGMWYAADGTEIGAVIWGEFAIIQEVENDPCAGIGGVQYLSPDHAGLGNW